MTACQFAGRLGQVDGTTEALGYEGGQPADVVLVRVGHENGLDVRGAEHKGCVPAGGTVSSALA